MKSPNPSRASSAPNKPFGGVRREDALLSCERRKLIREHRGIYRLADCQSSVGCLDCSQPGANVSVLQMLAQDLNPLDSVLRFGIAPACHVAALLGYTGFHSYAVMCNSMGVPKHLPKPGQHLRARRLSLGLTLRDVHMASLSLARELRKPAFVLPPSRLHDIETKEMTPSIHRLYTLTRVYRCRLNELLSWYGIPPR